MEFVCTCSSWWHWPLTTRYELFLNNIVSIMPLLDAHLGPLKLNDQLHLWVLSKFSYLTSHHSIFGSAIRRWVLCNQLYPSYVSLLAWSHSRRILAQQILGKQLLIIHHMYVFLFLSVYLRLTLSLWCLPEAKVLILRTIRFFASR